MADVVHTVVVSLCFVLIQLTGCLSSNDFLVLHAPNSVNFLQNPDKLLLSEVPDVVSLIYGFTANKDLRFQGLGAGSLFQRPRANVLIAVDGFTDNTPSLHPSHDTKLSLELDLPIYSTESVINNLQNSMAAGEKPFIVDLSADRSIFDLKSLSLFRDLPATADKMKPLLFGKSSLIHTHDVGSLNASRDADRTLLAELQLIEEIMKKVSSSVEQAKDSVPAFYSFAVSGYRVIVEHYGEKSQQASDAAQLISKYLEELTGRFRVLYKDRVVVEVVTLPSLRQHMSRKARSLLATQVGETQEEMYNIASVYDENFPVIFNIWVWFIIFFFLGVYGIIYTMVYMDPGKDSIIYRMTATRIKKD